MTPMDWVTLGIAVAGVLHGPYAAKILRRIAKRGGAR